MANKCSIPLCLVTYECPFYFLYSRPGDNIILVTTVVGNLVGLYF